VLPLDVVNRVLDHELVMAAFVDRGRWRSTTHQWILFMTGSLSLNVAPKTQNLTVAYTLVNLKPKKLLQSKLTTDTKHARPLCDSRATCYNRPGGDGRTPTVSARSTVYLRYGLWESSAQIDTCECIVRR